LTRLIFKLLSVSGVPCNRDAAWSIEQKTTQDALKWIHNQSYLSGLPIIAIVEAAPGTVGSNLSRHMNETAIQLGLKLYYMNECKDRAMGVMKDKNLQVAYRECLEFVLDRKNITIDVNLATQHPTNTPMREIERLCDMMRCYHRDEKTGIISSKVEGRPDDILAALNQMLYWVPVFWRDPYYINIRSEISKTTQHTYAFPSSGFTLVRTRKK